MAESSKSFSTPSSAETLSSFAYFDNCTNASASLYTNFADESTAEGTGSVNIVQPNTPLKQQDEVSLLKMGFGAWDTDQSWDGELLSTKPDITKKILKFIKSREYTDFQVHIGDRTFECQLLVLQANSELFRECDGQVSITLPEAQVSAAIFNKIYEWMFEYNSGLLFERSDIVLLFKAATYLRIEVLISHCWVCFSSRQYYTEDKAFELYMETKQHLSLEFFQNDFLLNRVTKYFLTLVASQQFLDLTATDFFNLMNANIGVNTELQVLFTVARWLDYDWEARKEFLLPACNLIRFGLLPPWFILSARNKTVTSVEVQRIIGCEAVKPRIHEGLSYHSTCIYFGNNSLEFAKLLKLCKIKLPKPRIWLYDESGKNPLECPLPAEQCSTYEAFLEYLKFLQDNPDFWRTQKVADYGNRSQSSEINDDRDHGNVAVFISAE